MNLISTVAGMSSEVGGVAWDLRCRDEDLYYRSKENERRLIHEARQEVDFKVQQLKAVGGASAFTGGFAAMGLANFVFDPAERTDALTSFSCISGLVIGILFFAMVNSTLLLVRVMKYDCVRREEEFGEFWEKKCENDWSLSLNAFYMGVICFMFWLAHLGWVAFSHHPQKEIAASCMTATILVACACWMLYSKGKWGEFILRINAEVVNLDQFQDE